MIDLRKRLIIGITAIVGVILAIVLYMLYLRNRPDVPAPLPSAPPEQGIPVDGAPATPQPGTQQPPLSLPAQDPDERYVSQLSEIFVERFGSYSNQNDNSHIDDSIALSTETMADWLRTQTLEQSAQYSGMTTHVITTDVQDITEATAVVEVGVQQTQSGAGGESQNYRTGRVELLKLGNDWKVDGFYWDR